MSLPTRECGLKFLLFDEVKPKHLVTPYAGVWIEIFVVLILKRRSNVTPYAGVWIEI